MAEDQGESLAETRHERFVRMKHAAVHALMSDPLFNEARNQPYFSASFRLASRMYVDKHRWSVSEQQTLDSVLGTSEEIPVVQCSTSRKPPQLLAGWGYSYMFILHPETMSLVHARRTEWRS